MQIIKLIILFIFPFCVFAQSPSVRSYYLSSRNFEYTPIPTPPVFTGTPTLLNVSFGSAVSQAELGSGVNEGLVPNPYEQRARTQSLTTVPPYKFKSQFDNIYSEVGGATISTDIFGQTGTPQTAEMGFYHMTGIGRLDASVTGGTWQASAPSAPITFSDIVFSNVSQGLRINDTTYQKVVAEFVRVFGRPTNHEFLYLGETSTSSYGVIDTLIVSHCFGYNKGWDGLQMNSANYVRVNNVTVYQVGLSNTSGQNSLLQAQNIGDGAVIENCLFWDAPRAFTIAARDITIKNCVFYSDNEGLYQDVVTQAGYTSPLSSVGGTVRFENCHFYSKNPRTNAININENNANFVFVDCVKGSNITNLYVDNRTDKTTYSISETGTTVLDTPSEPVFSSLIYSDYYIHGLIETPFFYNLGVGYRTPSPE